MSYRKWNNLLVNYFFENNDKEIILYVDEDLINQIGKSENLDYSNFLESTLPKVETRFKIFDDIIIAPNRDTYINRKLNGNIIKMPYVLANPLDLPNPRVNSRSDLPFFNFVALAILTMTKIIIEPNNSSRSYYRKLNEIISHKLPDNTRVTGLDKFDELFLEIEKYSNNRFRNRKIGTNKYISLIKYQVVLTPKEKKYFEKLMYENQIVINEDILYAELANKLYQIIPTTSTLRDKIKKGSEDRCYGDWLLNHAINFNHDKYFENLSDQDKENIKIKKTANFALALNLEAKKLILLTDLQGEQNEEIGDYSITTDRERVEDNFAIHPITINNTEKTEFKEYSGIDSDNYKISPIPIRDVNFFQKTNYGFYKQTLTTRENYDSIIVVKNNQNILDNWQNWISDEKNIEGVSEGFTNELTVDLFGENWVVYNCSGSIKASYYRNDNNFVGNTKYKGDDIDLEVRTVGGFKITNKVKTYVDVALPSFVIDIPDFQSNNLGVTIKREKVVDNSFKPIINKNFVQISVDDDLHIDEDAHIQVVFKYNTDNRSYQKEYDFSFKTSVIPEIDIESLYKLNSWGEKLSGNKKYYNGVSIINANNSNLSKSNHRLNNLSDDCRPFSDYFIHLLAGAFNINNYTEIDRAKLNEVIENGVAYLRNNDVDINIGKYSKFQLIENLIALGYINKDNGSNNTKFQLNPPTLRKIECAFNVNGFQIYKLTGARTKYFTQKLKHYCDENQVILKYSSISADKLNLAEYALLPDTIFINGNINTIGLSNFLKEYNLAVNNEDKINLGDSLLDFIAPINDFENKYLTAKSESFSEDFFEPTNKTDFPRIRIDANRSGNYGNYKYKRLEVIKGKVYNNIPLDWMENYVRYKHNSPVMMMSEPKRNGNDHTLYPNIYLYKYNRLPSIVFKALVEINHGLPEEKKIFYQDNSWNENDLNYSYTIFYKFNLSNNQERRRKLVHILTGNDSYLNNEQIVITNNEPNKHHMTYHYGDKMNTNFITIKQSGLTLALIIIMPYNKYQVYINSECFGDQTDNYANIEINSVQYPMVRIELIENINNTMSLILKNQFDDFVINNEEIKNLKRESIRSEEILIKEKL